MVFDWVPLLLVGHRAIRVKAVSNARKLVRREATYEQACLKDGDGVFASLCFKNFGSETCCV